MYTQYMCVGLQYLSLPLRTTREMTIRCAYKCRIRKGAARVPLALVQVSRILVS